MTSLSALQFEFDGQPRRFPIEESDPLVSPFTGQTLRRANTSFQVAPHEVELVKQLLAASPVADSEGTVWNGRLDREAYQDDGGPHLLGITWNEVEELHADAVEFQGLSLRPTKYEEHENDADTISIAFEAVLTTEETNQLRELMPTKRSGITYWGVVRRGVSDEPRSMRLGRVLWQQLPDGSIAHNITLADEGCDAPERSNQILAIRGEPEISNLVTMFSPTVR
jgi:hypothetical protein